MKLKLAGFCALGALGAATAVYAAEALAPAKVTAALKARLPNTEVAAIDCGKIGGVCEVVSGKTLFYVDGGGRYLFIGRVYDMETRQDLTAAKLLEINPAMLLGGAANAGGADDDMAAELAARPSSPSAAAARGPARKVDVSTLSPAGAIVWGKPQGEPVTIFTDFHCGYCKMLVDVLEQMNVKVIERPISTLGSRDVANRVYCARNKPAAIRAAYARAPLPAANCDTAGLDANEAFARTHGFSGTPVIVRKDGSVLEGYRPRDVLEAWLREGGR